MKKLLFYGLLLASSLSVYATEADITQELFGKNQPLFQGITAHKINRTGSYNIKVRQETFFGIPQTIASANVSTYTGAYPTQEVEILSVSQGYRGEGLGSALLKYILSQCPQGPCMGTVIYADPFDFNEEYSTALSKLLKFYRKNGGIMEDSRLNKLFFKPFSD